MHMCTYMKVKKSVKRKCIVVDITTSIFLLHQIRDETPSDDSGTSRCEPNLPRIFPTQSKTRIVVLGIGNKIINSV